MFQIQFVLRSGWGRTTFAHLFAAFQPPVLYPLFEIQQHRIRERPLRSGAQQDGRFLEQASVKKRFGCNSIFNSWVIVCCEDTHVSEASEAQMQQAHLPAYLISIQPVYISITGSTNVSILFVRGCSECAACCCCFGEFTGAQPCLEFVFEHIQEERQTFDIGLRVVSSLC